MTRRVPLACALAALVLTVQALRAAPPASGQDGLAGLAWLAGAWEGQAGEATLEEHWTPAAGGTMLGVNRTIRDGRTVAFEFLRIEERPEGLVYVAHPGGRSPGTEFVLTHLDDDEAVFRNPEHDYPTLIRYRRHPDGAMTASIGGGASGEESVRTFPYRRP